MNYTVTQRILINLTQMLCQVWFGWWKGEQTYPDESTSAFVFRTRKWTWGQITVTGTPVTSTAVGTYTKFGYSAKIGGLYRFTSATTKPWFFATE